MQPEKRYTASPAGRGVRLEKRVGTDPPYVIVGYGAVYYDPRNDGTEYCLWDFGDERCVERLMPGCFDRVMASPGWDCLCLYNHDANWLLGRLSSGTMTLTSDGVGLRFTVVPPDSPLHLGVAASVERGDVRGSSFSFAVDNNGERWVEKGPLVVREIHSVSGLYDVGPVASPAYAATTAGLRGQDAGAARRLHAARKARGGRPWSPNVPDRVKARLRVIELDMDRLRSTR